MAVLTVTAFFAVSAFFLSLNQNDLLTDCKRPELVFGDTRILVSVAQTPAEREKGLSGHAPLAPNEGMLFVYPVSGPANFWMKDMNFPIDIVWIDSDWRVLDVVANATVESYYTKPPTEFPSPPTMRYVLEIPSGAAEKRNISSGVQAVLSGCPN